MAQIAASIREFGFANPILVGADGRIIAGEGRYRAARELRLHQVPVIVLKHLSEVQRRALIIADNQLALNAGWDERLLSRATGCVKERALTSVCWVSMTRNWRSDWPSMRLPANSPMRMRLRRCPRLRSRGPATCGCWAARKGRPPHRVLCGDATVSGDTARLLADQPVLLMVTDPPYGVDLDPEWREHAGLNPTTRQGGKVANDDQIDWSEAWALFPGDVAYVWHAGIHAAEVALGLERCGFQIRSQIIWVKQHFAISRGAYHWQHEPCWYAVRKDQTGHWRGDRAQSTVWEIANLNPFGGEPTGENEVTGHGTQKPVEIMRRPILNHTRPGEACYDPFLGSGSTLIAAESTGRICYGIDIDPRYVDVTVLRWQKFTRQLAVLDSDGRTFEEIARVRRRKSGGRDKGPQLMKGGGKC